jgi:hypothetical protein
MVADQQIQTEDGINLIADVYTTGEVGAPGVVLLHMIPPGNSKSNFPESFITALTDKGLNVINVNRRGAPGSEGMALDAYSGPLGKWDARAGVDFLVNHACAAAAGKIAVVGASNGTTSAVDFSVWAAGDDAAEQPAALVFLSGGGYTENQNGLQANVATLGHPILFNYPASEAAWNVAAAGFGPDSWDFVEYSPGAHGTQMFQSNQESIAATADWIDTALP